MANFVHSSASLDAYTNLATDGFFLENHGGGVLLYIYVNENAVIIGRHQNAWRECNVAAMERDGVQLVRRHTGGGAVYHDCGNLNFSFILNEKDYDVQRQLGVIVKTVSKLGLRAEVSGRNDILLDGRKFSGNAFGKHRSCRAHHGTLLVSSDLSRLGKYLNPSAAKLRAKGVGSVQARVCSLCELDKGITTELVRRLLVESFIEEYGSASPLELDGRAAEGIEKKRVELASWEWRFGRTPHFDLLIENRFGFGELQLHLALDKGRISGAKVYTDCLDTGLASELEQVLIGHRLTVDAVSSAVSTLENKAAADEIIDYFVTNGING